MRFQVHRIHLRFSLAALAVIWGALLPAQLPQAAAQVVADDDSALVVDTEEEGANSWKPLVIVSRDADSGRVYFRQTAEVYGDPDKPKSLELKYIFDLDDSVHIPVGQLAGGAADYRSIELPAADGQPTRTIQAAKLDPPGAESEATALERQTKLPLISTADEPIEAQWIDYRSEAKPKAVAILDTSGDGPVTLSVRAVDPESESLRAGAVIGLRELERSHLPSEHLAGGLMSTWDRPGSVRNAYRYFSRVIAVLVKTEHRYAVDFFGEKLHVDSDCRVLLTPHDHPWGKPVAIGFVDLPLGRTGGNVERVGVLGVIYRNDEGKQRQIAFDFPICSTQALSQMRRAAELLPRNRSNARPGPDLRQVLGAYVAEEIERRLVAGRYH